jgi:PAS domain-containing protein
VVTGIDATPLAFGLVSLSLLVAMSRHDLFDVASVAHETVFSELDDAIVVVDEDGRMVEPNPAALEAFSLDDDWPGADAARVLPDAVVEAGLLDGEDAEIALDGADAGVEGPATDRIDDIGTVVVLRLRTTGATADAPTPIEQMDPWGVAAAGAERTDGGPTEWRPLGESTAQGAAGDEN